MDFHLSTYLNELQQIRIKLAVQNNQLRSTPAKLAQIALLKEVDLTPKPGLVDQISNGAHRDMNLLTFLQSISAITPYLDDFYNYGINSTDNHIEYLMQLRTIGSRCETAMFIATQNINTHKGAIFAFALILSSLGQLHGRKKTINYITICNQIAVICQDIVERELMHNSGKTVGERLYNQYHFTGARGEAQSGYALITKLALPIYFECRQQGYTEQQALWQIMLNLLANNNDTNVVSRGGIEGLNFVKSYATKLLHKKSALSPSAIAELQQFDVKLIEKNISPGGTADLIAVTWFLSNYQI